MKSFKISFDGFLKPMILYGFYRFLRKTNPRSHQFLVKLPPLVGQLVAHGLIVVLLGAGDEMVPLVALVVVLQERHIHPPLARDFVAKEDYIILIIANLHIETLEVGAFQGRDVVLAVGEAFHKVPNHLGDEVGRA